MIVYVSFAYDIIEAYLKKMGEKMSLTGMQSYH